eukprot:GFUD01044768.1.p1 GENE.GFUD01044768.1~~GFUD01044768.1.p1  ORF type:complete len:581 (-),score=135.69 GFUD01044768.1:143-1885(-)
METEPWKIINHLFPDLVFLVEGKKLYYHQAVLAQHSQLVKSLLLKNSCCKCFGVDCSRNAGNVFITLDSVKVNTVQYVMDMIYAGGGNIAGDTDDYKSVVDMLHIDTILVDAVDAPEGFIMEEIISEIGSDMILDNVHKGSSLISDALEEESRKVDQELKETNKALRKLEKEKKKLALEEKKKQEMEKKRDRRSRNRKPINAEEKNRDESIDNQEETEKGNEIETKEKKTLSTVIEIGLKGKVNTMADSPKLATVPIKSSSEPKKSSADDDDCEIIIDSENENEKNQTSIEEVKSDEVERYICPFKDCRSESKNAQSIKVHLALVHYKKTIQSEFPNWKKQKCDECDKSFGQMTAYYLHMANHKKYQYMDLPADALKPKDDVKPVPKEKVTQPTSQKPNSSFSIPMSISKSSSSVSTPTSKTNSLRTSGAIIKPANILPVRSNSFVQSNTMNQVIKTNSFSAGLRSKSFVQTKSQTPPAGNKLQSLIVRNPISKNSPSSSTTTFGRPAPPGPPGPPSGSSTRSSSLFGRATGTILNANKKPSDSPSTHQRRLSAPFSVVHKRTSSVDRPATKDTKKTRGS